MATKIPRIAQDSRGLSRYMQEIRKFPMLELAEGDVRPDQVRTIAPRFGVAESDVVSMTRRLAGDPSFNAPVRADSEAGEWLDWLVDDSPSQEDRLGETQELDQRRSYLSSAL